MTIFTQASRKGVFASRPEIAVGKRGQSEAKSAFLREGAPERTTGRHKKDLPSEPLLGIEGIRAYAQSDALHGKVAQLVRACGSYPQCRGFKSLPCYQN